ncbi:aldo/keto reductase [Pleomorphovibrio marinus]|uniref:aldo/keto reductase n=1 Tax=Pleomorphovibrio marinus TaxID=2164132 RepID=UPI000E0C8B8C|nr:aldo/keto reductase [Pleomorphovibrio marinus]
METRVLGNTGLKVSEIAFGGVEIGLPYGIGVHSTADMLQEKDALKLLELALDKGINFYDTARMYGESEKLIGKAFRTRRSQVLISTKCRHFRLADGALPDSHLIPKIIRDSLEESLRELKTDYLDVYMLHQADLEIIGHQAITDTFQELKASGKVGSIGASTYTLEESQHAIQSGIWEVVQLPFNLMDQRQSTLFELASERGVGVVIRSVLLKGLLSERGKNLPEPLANVEKHLQGFGHLAARKGIDLPSLALGFALSFPEVASVLVGIDKEEYLLHALASANGSFLSEKEMEIAKDLAYPDPAFINLPLWDKKGWLT